jgi:rod shape-determining protein MreD
VNRSRQHHGAGAIILSILAAFVLTALPLPAWASDWRPAWVALVLIYWCMAVPTRVGVGVGWLLGLLLDVLLGTLLGQHALGLAVVAYITQRLHQRVRVLPIWQQGISIFTLVFFYQALMLWIHGILGKPVQFSSYWAVPLTSMLLWPWVFIILRDMRRRYRVS